MISLQVDSVGLKLVLAKGWCGSANNTEILSALLNMVNKSGVLSTLRALAAYKVQLMPEAIHLDFLLIHLDNLAIA